MRPLRSRGDVVALVPRVLPALLVALLVLAAPAAAAPPVATTPDPDGRPIVLEARETRDAICLDLVRSGRRGPVGCVAKPKSAEDDAEAVVSTVLRGRRPFRLLLGITTARTAVVSVGFARGRPLELVGQDAVGYAGRYRFLLGTHLGPAEPVYVRALDPDGQVRAAAEPDPFARPPVRGPVVLARGRLPGLGRLAFSALVRSFLAPRPGRPEARERVSCLRIDIGDLGEQSCASGLGPLDVHYIGDCDAAPVAFYGTVTRRAERVDVVWSGRAHRARVVNLPAGFGFGAHRGFVLASPRAARDVTVVARTRAGRLVDRLQVTVGRVSDLCGGSVGTIG